MAMVVFIGSSAAQGSGPQKQHPLFAWTRACGSSDYPTMPGGHVCTKASAVTGTHVVSDRYLSVD